MPLSVHREWPPSRVSHASWSGLLGVGVLVLVGPGCFSPPCDFSSRCTAEGQYEQCYVDTHENAQHVPVTCGAPNAACIDDDETARCVYAPATACDASFVDRCEGSLRVYCDEVFGWVQAVDCASLGSPGCQVDGPSGKAVCD